MLVTGGRSRWVRAVSWWGGLSSVALVGGSGCGSRTSMLDPDVYSDDVPSFGGSSSGASSKGGSPSFPSGGATMKPMPTAGQPRMQPDPSASSKTCQSYCKGYASKCPAQLMGQNCQLACEEEMNGYGKKCQTLGLKALKCLTPSFKADGVSCEASIGSALNKCRAEVDKFDDCKGIDEPVPQPQPPKPQPNPTPTSCPGMGEAGPGYCKMSYACANGPYTIACGYSGGGMAGSGPVSPWYNCQCYDPYGNIQDLTLYTLDDPCGSAAYSCFSGQILK